MAEPQITTKDVVLELGRKVDQLVLDMAEVKVLASSVAALAIRASDFDVRLRAVEDKLAEERGERAYRRWFPAALATLASGIWWVPSLFHHKP